jgi:hypothetical protein
MQKVLLGATLGILGLALGGCGSGSPSALQTSSLSAADPAPEQERDAAFPERGLPRSTEERDLGEPSVRRAPVLRGGIASRSTETPPDLSSPQVQVEQEVTGADMLGSAPSAAGSTMEELRRKKQLEEDRNLAKLDQSAARALRSICSGC